MPLYPQDIDDIRNGLTGLRDDVNYTLSGVPPQFSVYSAMASEAFTRGPLVAAVRAPFTLINQQSINALLKANIYGFAFNRSLYNAVNLSGFGSLYNSIRFPGMWGTRHFQSLFLKPLAGMTSRIPIVGTLVRGYTEAALGFNLNLANVPWLKMSDTVTNEINRILQTQGLVDEFANTSDPLVRAIKFSRMNTRTFVDDIISRSANLDAAQRRASRQLARDVATNINKIKFVGALTSFLDFGFKVWTSYDISSNIGKLVAGAVRLGSNYTEFVNNTATKFIDRARRVEMGGDLSSYLTQAAVTERTRALQIMQSSRVNGAYQYGNETEFI